MEKKNNFIYWSIFFIVIFIAIYVRLVGLGKWGILSSDEYYIAQTGRNILKYGLPKFDTGGFYTRGILYEYLSIIFIYLGGKDIFVYRFISVLFNIISVPALYLLIKKISNRSVALSAVILFLFSMIEIEYSRLARFYTTFQAFFLWYIYFLYEVIINNKQTLKKWMYLLSFLSVFVYEGAIFIVTLNFLFLLYHKEKIKPKDVIITIALFVFTFIYLKIDFRNLGVVNYLPSDMSIKTGSKSSLTFPNILLLTIKGFSFWWILLGGVFSFSLLTLKKIGTTDVIFKIVLFLIVIFSFLNQFGLVFYTIILFVLSPFFKKNYLDKNLLQKIFLIITLNFGFWLIYSFFTKNWYKLFPNLNSFSIKKVLWIFFNYPDIYQSLLLPWLQPLPIQTVLTLFILFVILLLVIYGNKILKNNSDGVSFILTIIILMSLGVSIVRTPYYYSRYSFFIHPLVLSLIPLALFCVINLLKIKFPKYILLFVLIIYVFASEDYSFHHISHIDSKKVVFKEGFNKKRTGMYYFREDYKTVGETINKYSSKDDIIVTLLTPADYYLDKLDYCYRNFNDKEFTGRSRENGKKEIWTNSNLIYKKDSLYNILKIRKKTVWLITFSNKRYYASKLNRDLNKEFQKYLFYTNLNNTINVYKLSPNIKSKI